MKKQAKADWPTGEETEKLQKELCFRLPNTNRPKGKQDKKDEAEPQLKKRKQKTPFLAGDDVKTAAKKGDFVLKEP